MPWQLVDPRYYAGRATLTDGAISEDVGRAFWYQDDSSLDTGDLVLHVDDDGAVVWFQLSHTKWPHGHEHVADWRAGAGLRIGQVSGDEAGAGAHYRHMSPTVHFLAQPDGAVLSDIVDYFLTHADALDPQHREAISQALLQGCSAS